MSKAHESSTASPTSPANHAWRLVDAWTLARMLGVSRRFVYEHADDLGAVRLGGPKGRLRFDPEAVRRAMRCESGKASQPETASGDGASGHGRLRGGRRVPNGLPKPGSVLVIRGPATPLDRSTATSVQHEAQHAEGELCR